MWPSFLSLLAVIHMVVLAVIDKGLKTILTFIVICDQITWQPNTTLWYSLYRVMLHLLPTPVGTAPMFDHRTLTGVSFCAQSVLYWVDPADCIYTGSAPHLAHRCPIQLVYSCHKSSFGMNHCRIEKLD